MYILTEFPRTARYRCLRAVPARYPEDFGRERGAGRHRPRGQVTGVPQLFTDQGNPFCLTDCCFQGFYLC